MWRSLLCSLTVAERLSSCQSNEDGLLPSISGYKPPIYCNHLSYILNWWKEKDCERFRGLAFNFLQSKTVMRNFVLKKLVSSSQLNKRRGSKYNGLQIILFFFPASAEILLSNSYHVNLSEIALLSYTRLSKLNIKSEASLKDTMQVVTARHESSLWLCFRTEELSEN